MCMQTAENAGPENEGPDWAQTDQMRRVYTARRYAKRGICRRRVSVRLCVRVCLSVFVLAVSCVAPRTRRSLLLLLVVVVYNGNDRMTYDACRLLT